MKYFILQIDISPTGTFINTEILGGFELEAHAEKFFTDTCETESKNWENDFSPHAFRCVFTNKGTSRRPSATCILEIKTVRGA